MAKTNPEAEITCPKCGSDQVKFELRSAGTTSKTNYYRTGVKKSWFIPSGYKTRESQRNYKSIAVCQNCGHHWEVGAPGFLTTVISWVIIIAILVVAFKACSSSSSNSSADSPADETQEVSIWASEYTPLSDFEYYIDEEAIFLKKYIGESKKVYIAPSYTVDGRDLPVTSLNGSSFFSHVDSIIISEGIADVAYAAFNGCGVDFLYFPSTVTSFSGWGYFHDVEKIYYGGSKESWGELYEFDRANLDVVEIVYDAAISELLSAE